jgi:tetratricopeptide (TPR) repeat protein
MQKRKSISTAVELEAAETSDRATAYHYLFKVYGIQKRVDEAVEAWEQATRLDPVLEATAPDLVRMLIHWYHYDTAESYLQRESCMLRRTFYQDLINVKRSPVFPRSTWGWVTKYDPKALDEAHDEFAEACVRFVKPQLALEAIEPLVDHGDFNRLRLVLAGLAWAQQRMIDRAKWALDLALRVGDLERPRGTRRSVGGRRILDTESRILYGEIIVDPDIREEIDRYFMPVVDND